jgi:tRNA modification GTPase
VPYLRIVKTIVALSTPVGSGAIGVLRLSGPEALAIVKHFTPSLPNWKPRYAHFARFEVDGTPLDEVVAIWYKGPLSYTGEDVVELSFHGSPYVLETALEALCQQGATLAQPGEFTQRAFFHGKLDLSQAEAVGDLIAAESRSAHRLAFRQMKGSISRHLQGLRQQLIDFAALIELELDFVEEDVEFAQRAALQKLLSDLTSEIKRMLKTFQLGHAIKEGIPLVLAGAPNAGKSTLLNRLLQEDRAIVTDIPGTTRDTLEERFRLGAHLFRLMDTAGLHDSMDPQLTNPTEAQQLNAEIQKNAPESTCLTVLTKADQWPKNLETGSFHATLTTGEGHSLEALEGALHRVIEEQGWNGQADVLIANVRHASALEAAEDALTRAANGLHEGISGELVAYDLREALHHLGSITGEIVADDLLSSVFSRFCIGK